MTALSFGAASVTLASLSELSAGILGSQILRIAAEVRARRAAGHDVCNLTVGDFDPRHFPIPEVVREDITRALREGQTNYPPADGLPELHDAIRGLYRERLALDYPPDSVAVAAGARPLIYAAYRCLLDPGDRVVFPVPSWNNPYYVHLAGARADIVPTGPDTHFFPTVDALAPLLPTARLLVLNSPSNPTGTMVDPAVLRSLCELIVDENARREAKGRKGLWLCFDQVYWQLTFGTTVHATPPGLLPEMARYTVLLDAASKSYAATGLRVGWGLMPPPLRHRMADLLGHMGAWAPRPEQWAFARFLGNTSAETAYRRELLARVAVRLDKLARGFADLKREGFPVDVIPPAGAIYLSVRIDRPGLSNEAIRRHLLDEGGFAVVPFQAFGWEIDSGWFRLSVGAISEDDIEAAWPRLRRALETLPNA